MQRRFFRALTSIVDLLIPRSERSMRAERTRALAPHVHTTYLRGRAIVSLASYATTEVKDAVGALKFERSGAAQALLAHLFDDYVMEEVWEQSLKGAGRSLVVPVPLSARRRASRGFNQVEEVLKKTRAVRDGYVSLVTTLLTRTRDTKPQATLRHHERTENVAGAFALSPQCTHPLIGVHLFLVDDVVTTGSTLAEAARPLEKAGAKVTCVALSRA